MILYCYCIQIREKAEKRAFEIQDEVAAWDPHNDPNANSDAFKTLFVSRIVSNAPCLL